MQRLRAHVRGRLGPSEGVTHYVTRVLVQKAGQRYILLEYTVLRDADPAIDHS